MRETRSLLLDTDFPAITRGKLDTLQVNLGYKCNLSCTHCHVNAGPTRTELMDESTIDLLLQYIDEQGIATLDLTGGAPELNPHFRKLVKAAKERGVHVMDRCNLTVLLEPGMEDMAQFLADNDVEVVASLPCYSEDNVDKQRGKGTFDGSMQALQMLNQLGYGKGHDKRKLSLVYNPTGAFLPPPQGALEQDYKRELKTHFGIEFDQLFTITNMPISRFGSVLLSKGEFDDYMQLLKSAYSDANLSAVMCRNLVSVDWQGYVYDCDFNQMLDMPMAMAVQENSMIASDKARPHLSALLGKNLDGMPIVVAEHCYGCTAGQGSSCGGALD